MITGSRELLFSICSSVHLEAAMKMKLYYPLVALTSLYMLKEILQSD